MHTSRQRNASTQCSDDQELWSALEAQKPHFLSSTAYLNLIIHQAIDEGFKLGARPAGAGSLSSVVNKEEDDRAREELINRPPTPVAKAPKDPYTKRNLSLDLVPEDLTKVADALLDFWSVKKGTRSERAWTRLCDKLRGWGPPQTRRRLLQRHMTRAGRLFMSPNLIRLSRGKWEPSTSTASKVFTAEAF